MIVTVTLNAALDATYVVPKLALGSVHRVEEVHRQAGGKGINVSRTLVAMGVATLATGLIGGDVGDQIRQELVSSGIAEALVEVSGVSRQTVVVAAGDGTFIEFDEPGMVVPESDWDRFLIEYSASIIDASVVVLSGSLPRSLPRYTYRTLTERAHRAGARVLLDASGFALTEALAARPDMVKPNEAELAQFVGKDCRSTDAVVKASAALLRVGAGAVVASRGAHGAIALSADETLMLSHPLRRGNPVGAGDALSAGLAAGLAAELSFASCVRQGVTWALASLANRWAGDVDPVEVAACGALINARPIRRTELPVP